MDEETYKELDNIRKELGIDQDSFDEIVKYASNKMKNVTEEKIVEIIKEALGIMDYMDGDVRRGSLRFMKSPEEAVDNAIRRVGL